MKLSIVLTIYNKEPFLRRAFETILSQENTEKDDFEVIAVNDGSTDGCACIIEEFAKRDFRVKVLSQENQGLSMARNNGVDAANGDYIWFVDADDVISSQSVRRICDAMVTKPDVIPIYAQTEGCAEIRNRVPGDSKTGNDLLRSEKWQACSVFNILSRSFILDNNLRFYPGIYHEDCEFTPRMLYTARTVVVVPEILYTVFREPNSITQVPRVKRAFDYLIVANSLDVFYKDKVQYNELIRPIFNYFISMMINNAFDIVVKNSNDDQKRFDAEFDGRRNLLRPLKDTTVLKYRIEALLFRIFSGHYVRIYKTMKLIGR